MDRRLSRILGDKPELVTSFPGWMLPSETVDALRRAENPAVLEVAGRDSVAAAVRAVAEIEIDAALPTIAYTGTQFGDWEVPLKKSAAVKDLLADVKPGVNVFDPIVIGSPRLWWILNGRYLSVLLKRFGFFTPCLGCHLYLHVIRVPLAKLVGSTVVVAGERESHDGRVKLNQTGPALDAYVELLARFDVQLALPIRHVASGAEVEELAGGTWDEGEGQLECVMSGNYRDISGDVAFDEDSVTAFLREFAVPVAGRAVYAYITGETPDYANLADGLL